MAKQVEFWFDYGSPASYIGYYGLKQVAARTGARIVWKPMLLGGVFHAINSHSPMTVAAKARWMTIDLKNHADRLGLPFELNPFFIFNTMPLMRGALVALERGETERYSDTVFDAIWRDGLNMGDPAVIADVLAEAGFDAAAYLEGAQRPDIKEKLKEETEAAVKKGIFGAPTMFVGDKMWWGQDRLDWVENELGK